MSIQQEVSQYLAECGVFYFGTVDGDAPAVRPLGFQMFYNDRLYLGIGTHKAVYAQLVANPNVTIVAVKPDGSSWIRISAKAVCDNDPALEEAGFEAMPQLRPLYKSNGWTMGMLHFEDATVNFYEQLMAPVRTETF